MVAVRLGEVCPTPRRCGEKAFKTFLVGDNRTLSSIHRTHIVFELLEWGFFSDVAAVIESYIL